MSPLHFCLVCMPVYVTESDFVIESSNRFHRFRNCFPKLINIEIPLQKELTLELFVGKEF